MSLANGAVPIQIVANGTNVASGSVTGLTSGRGLVVPMVFLNNNSTGESLVSASIGSDNLTIIAASIVHNVGFGWSGTIAYVPALTAGGSQTFTATFSAAVNGAVCWPGELYSTVSGGISLDVGGGNAANSTDPTATLITTANNSAIWAMCALSSSAGTTGSGYTDFGFSNFFNFEEGEYDLDAGTAGSVNVTWTAASQQWVLTAAAFKEAGGGPPPPSNVVIGRSMKSVIYY